MDCAGVKWLMVLLRSITFRDVFIAIIINYIAILHYANIRTSEAYLWTIVLGITLNVKTMLILCSMKDLTLNRRCFNVLCLLSNYVYLCISRFPLDNVGAYTSQSLWRNISAKSLHINKNLCRQLAVVLQNYLYSQHSLHRHSLEQNSPIK